MKLNSSYQKLGENFCQKYPQIPQRRLGFELSRIQELVVDSRDLIGKRVLDIGCGSIQSPDRGPIIFRHIREFLSHNARVQFHPWYCRILQETAARPIGIDLGSNQGEAFENYQLDLTDPGALSQFKDESFDGANNVFLSVPRESKHARYGFSPKMLHDLSMDQERAIAINDQIFKHVERILKDKGVYTLAEFVFQKRRGRLQKQKSIPNW